MTTSGAMRGATALRLARRDLSPAVVLDLSRVEVFGLLGTEPLARFTTAVGALIDRALDDALSSTPSEVVPTGPADRSRRPSLVPRSAIDRSAPSASAIGSRPRRPRSAATRPATADVARRPLDSPLDTHPAVSAVAGAPEVRPTVAAPPLAPLPGVVAIATKNGAAPSVAATDAASAGDPDVSPAAWARRVAALGAVTPVVIEPVPTHQLQAPQPRLDRWRPDRPTADDHHRAMPPRDAQSATEPRRPEHHEDAVRETAQPVAPSEPAGRSQLAGLAHWWNETHGPTEPSPIDAPALPPKTPAARATGTRRQPTSPTSFDATGPDELRAVFNGLLEEALLTEARADGIEVRP